MQVGRTPSQSAPPAPSGRSVRAHLLALVIITTVIVSAGSVYSFNWSLGQAEDDASERMTFQSVRAATSITQTVSTATQAVTQLAAQPGLDAVFVDSTGCTLTFDGTGAFPDVRLDLVRADGVVVCSSGELPTPPDAAVHADAGWLAEALSSTSPAVSEDSIDNVSEQRAIAITTPVRAADPGPAAGVVVAFLHQEPAAAAMTREFGSSTSDRFALLDREDREVLSASDRLLTQTGASIFRTAGTAGSMTNSDGERFIYGTADVEDSDWRVIAALPHDRVFAEARGALLRQGALGALAVVVLIAGVWLLNRRIEHPLREVTEAAKEASRNPSAVHVREAGTTETIALARSFNAMLDIRTGYEAQLAHQATHDALTGLPNTALLVQRMERALAEGKPVSVISLGLDRFRKINEAVGHHAGDRLLREVAERLTARLGEGQTLARFGSDQFVMLCENVTADCATALATRTQSALTAPFRGPFGEVALTATAGITTGTGAETSSSQLLREADTALHEAKTNARPQHVYEPTMQNRAAAHLTIQRDLARALEDDQLVVFYQPLMDLASGAVVGAEALVRWQHPGRGLVPPNDFIPVAEQTGQICELGAFVLRQACEQAVRWAVAGHRLTISVNVAAAQLREGGFPGLVQQVLADTGLLPRQLCLEITESSLMTGSAHIDKDLAQLRRLGVHLALDDFGTGYSSLSYLQQLPCDELKIDRSFVSRLDHDKRQLHLVTAIVGMARALGLTVVAEGVESDQQRRLLAELGCQQAQGYLFSPPVPEPAFTAFLATSAPVRAAHSDVLTAALPAPGERPRSARSR